MNTPQTSNRYRALLIVAVLLLVIVSGWFFFYSSYNQPAETLQDQFSWRLVDSEDNLTVVSLRIAGVPLVVGAYAGECQNPESLLQDELSGIVCREGTGGTEIGVFSDNGELVLKEGAIDPATGRGANFAPIVREQ